MRITPLEGSGVKHTDVKINEMTRTIATILLLATGLMAADKDNWQRTKDCTAQAEKFAREHKDELIQNHYSPKYGRCYAELVQSDAIGTYYTVFDPFERKMSATWISRSANCARSHASGGTQGRNES